LKHYKVNLKETCNCFPDFTDESLPDFSFPIMKQIQDKAAGRKIIGLLGSLDKRKGFLTLLEVSQKW